jgi:hypothetical protein
MKAGFLALFLVLAGTGTAFAGTCVVNTYDNYVGPPSISCTITDKTFSNFFYSTSGSVHLPPNDITVNPIATPYDPGLLGNAPWGVTALQTQDSLLGFTVRVTSGSALITDLSLLMLGAGITGTGMATVVETYCLGDTFSDMCAHGTTGTLMTYLTGSSSKLSDQVYFKGVSEVDVMKDIMLKGGDNGSAVISGVENQFSEIPEPASLAVLGSGLIGMGGLLRKRLFA